jgi:hypothetical protein
MSGLFMYGDCRRRSRRLSELRRKTFHLVNFGTRRIERPGISCWIMTRGVPESVLERRVKELLPHHAGLSDCRVAAETRRKGAWVSDHARRQTSAASSGSHQSVDRASDRTVGLPRYRLCALARNGPGAGQSVERLRLVASPGLLIVGSISASVSATACAKAQRIASTSRTSPPYFGVSS